MHRTASGLTTIPSGIGDDVAEEELPERPTAASSSIKQPHQSHQSQQGNYALDDIHFFSPYVLWEETVAIDAHAYSSSLQELLFTVILSSRLWAKTIDLE